MFLLPTQGPVHCCGFLSCLDSCKPKIKPSFCPKSFQLPVVSVVGVLPLPWLLPRPLTFMPQYMHEFLLTAATLCRKLIMNAKSKLCVFLFAFNLKKLFN